jgi:phosphoglucomutase
MTLYYKNQGMSLYDALIELYKKYEFYKEDIISIELAGKEGQEKIQKAMEYLRISYPLSINGIKIAKKMDYKISSEENLSNNIVG